MKASELFELPKSLPFSHFFDPEASPWTWVEKIKEALNAYDFDNTPQREDVPHQLVIEGPVFIHSNVTLPAYGYIKGPAFIGAYTELRPGVYIRGNVIVGEKCVLGNSCEFKNCLLMDAVQTPHFNYIGDSILGTGAHLAAGAITANLRLDRKPVSIKLPNETISTHLKKLGALIGEFAEVGCNATLQPGTILGKNSAVGPNTPFGGYLAPHKKAYLSPESIIVA